MNDEPTKDLPNRTSFEERVFARFDAVDARFDAVDARLTSLESRAYDTKPIWERALKAIMEMGLELGEVKSKVAVIETDVAGLKTDVGGVKTHVAAMKTDYAGIKNELTDMKRELKHQVNKRLDLILEFLLEGRDDLRGAEERIKQLETKLA
jgi:chromosome segregation ATPase